ncbi:PEPxxWA-CTERM sorting domain-containing protein [Sphingomonas sp. 22176]|uniref:PEPxxWA-CTERM sorting domain-containing protein n=1 Tax=Sphingomonas sp. 22176 TaxID=3453884 RepID=UPI003F8632FE
MRTAFMVAALGLLAVGSGAQAAPIVYSFSGQISGALNGQAFSLSDYTLSLATDTDTVFQPRPDFRPSLYNSGLATLSFTINGVSGTFATQFNAFSVTLGSGSGQRALVGFTEAEPFGNDLIDVRDPGLLGYDLKTGIVSASNSPINFLNFGTTFQTSAGELIFLDDYDASATFRASLSAVPEPASWAMLLVGFGLMGAAIRRRAKVTVRYA